MFDDDALLGHDDFDDAFGESIRDTLNLDTWTAGEDLATLYERLAQEVHEAVAVETELRKEIRKQLFPRIKGRSDAPQHAGIYQATQADIERIHKNILFNGGVESCDGNSNVHDTLPLTITQLGVSLVSYSGEKGSWVHRLFRRDLRSRAESPAEEAIQLLEKRNQRGGLGLEDRHEKISQLGRRGIMAYAERSVLLEKSGSPWRMGHGVPAPYEILTGSGMMTLLEAGLNVLVKLLGEHKRFVFIPSAPRERLWLTIGEALRPLEFAIVETAHERMMKIVENGHYAQRYKRMAADFVNAVGHDILIGVYRASEISPAYIFYGHREYIHEAALIAMADSVLQPHRGFPMLIDLADSVCRGSLGLDGFAPSVETAYIDAGAPFRYQNERATRNL
jgi:hypothetical protein